MGTRYREPSSEKKPEERAVSKEHRRRDRQAKEEGLSEGRGGERSSKDTEQGGGVSAAMQRPRLRQRCRKDERGGPRGNQKKEKRKVDVGGRKAGAGNKGPLMRLLVRKTRSATKEDEGNQAKHLAGSRLASHRKARGGKSHKSEHQFKKRNHPPPRRQRKEAGGGAPPET